MTAALIRCDGTSLSTCSTALPFGLATYSYIDLDGLPHNFSITQLKVVVLAIENFVASLYAQLLVGLAGGSPSWPSSTVTVP